MRPADRERVLELTADIWDGDDYIGDVFERWVADPGSWFQAAELGGFLVGFQRLRPLAPGLLWYEGLRVASTHRHRGIAGALVEEACTHAARLGFHEVRLASGGAHSFFSRLGFQHLLEVGDLVASRVEGGEPARLPPPGDAARLLEQVRRDGAFSAYQGLNADIGGSRDLDLDELELRLGKGQVRTVAGGRALAIVRPSSGGSRLRATFVSGSGGALRELLEALRFEADADGRSGVALLVPDGHPGYEAMLDSGFQVENWSSGSPVRFHILARQVA